MTRPTDCSCTGADSMAVETVDGEFSPAQVAAVGTLLGGLAAARGSQPSISQRVEDIRSVVSLASDAGAAVREAMTTIRYSLTPGQLRTEPRLTGRSQSAQFEFEVGGRGASVLSGDPALYRFRLNVDFDCYNIRNAQIQYNRARSSPSRRAGTLNLTIRPRTERYTTVPASIEFVITGTWNPSDTNILDDVTEPIYGVLMVRADGQARMRWNGRSARYHRIGGLQRISGGRGSCQSYYAQQTSQNRGGIAPTPSPSPSPTPSPAPRPSGGGRRRSSTPGYSPPDIPHPPNGRHIFFAFNRAQPSLMVRNEVAQWWMALGPQLQVQITSGRRRVLVQGHADPVGSRDANVRISNQRARLVAEIIREFAPSAQVQAAGFGYDGARQAGVSGRAPEWRRATILVAPL